MDRKRKGSLGVWGMNNSFIFPPLYSQLWRIKYKESETTLLIAEQDPVPTEYRASHKLFENVAHSSFLPGEGVGG